MDVRASSYSLLHSNCRHQAVDVRASSYSLLQSNCRHQAVDVRASSYSLLQSNCRHQAVDVRASSYSLLQSNCRHQAVDVRASSYSLQQSNCRHQAVDVRASSYSLQQSNYRHQAMNVRAPIASYTPAVVCSGKKRSRCWSNPLRQFSSKCQTSKCEYHSQFANFSQFSWHYSKYVMSKQLYLCRLYCCHFILVYCECRYYSFEMKLILKQQNQPKKCQATVYTNRMGDIPLNQNSVHDRIGNRAGHLGVKL